MSRVKVLLINTQFIEVSLSGLTNRFTALWIKSNKQQQPTIHLLTNKSLLQHFNLKSRENVTVINLHKSIFKFTSRLYYPLFIVYVFFRHKCTSIHIGTSMVNTLLLTKIFRMLRIKYCVTFASQNIEMASYNSDYNRRFYGEIFRKTANIDFLNPNVDVQFYGNKFISPCSFPYIDEINQISPEFYRNKNRNNWIVYSGSLIKQKNPDLAFYGFEIFLKKYRSYHKGIKLIYFGDGNLKSKILELITKSDLQEYIYFKDYKYYIDTLSKSKVFLSLQDYDNYPSQSVMEAMLFCNSIISINNGFTSVLVKKENGNSLLNTKDPEVLAEKIHFHLLKVNILNVKNHYYIKSDFSSERFLRYFNEMHAKIIDR